MTSYETEQQEIFNDEEKGRNDNFVMFFRKHAPEIDALLKENPVAYRLFYFIANNMNHYNALVASYQVFMEALDISKATTYRSIKLLQEKGLLEIKKSGSSNIYILNQEIVWTSWANNKQYCEFTGKIMLAKSENPNYIYKK